MVVLNIVFVPFAVVYLDSLADAVGHIGFVYDGVAFVLLVREDGTKAMRVEAGFAPMEDMLAELDAEEDDLQFAMTAYGLCVLLEAHSETEKADALRQKLLVRDGFWFCFSYLNN